MIAPADELLKQLRALRTDDLTFLARPVRALVTARIVAYHE